MESEDLWKWAGQFLLMVGVCMSFVAIMIEFLIVGFLSWPTTVWKINWILFSIVLVWIGTIMIAFTIDW
jgi:hypothetical protein